MGILQVIACKSHLSAIQLKEWVCFVFKTLTNSYSLANIRALNLKYTRCIWLTVFSLRHKRQAMPSQSIRKAFQALPKGRKIERWVFFFNYSLLNLLVWNMSSHHTCWLSLARGSYSGPSLVLCCPQGTTNPPIISWLDATSYTNMNIQSRNQTHPSSFVSDLAVLPTTKTPGFIYRSNGKIILSDFFSLQIRELNQFILQPCSH